MYTCGIIFYSIIILFIIIIIYYNIFKFACKFFDNLIILFFLIKLIRILTRNILFLYIFQIKETIIINIKC